MENLENTDFYKFDLWESTSKEIYLNSRFNELIRTLSLSRNLW